MAAVCTAAGLADTAFPSAVRAQPGPDFVITLRERPLRAGDRTELIVDVTLVRGGDSRLVLTPSTEGQTLEVVRGRLMGFEARSERDAEGRTRLTFAVPVIAHAPGAAVLRVEVDALYCSDVCAPLYHSERFSIDVEPARAPR